MSLELFKIKDPLSDIFTTEFDFAVISFSVNGENKHTIYDLLLECKSNLQYNQITSIYVNRCTISTPKLFKVYDRINECKLDMKFINNLVKSKVENSPPVFDRKVNAEISCIRYQDMIKTGNTPIIRQKKKSSSGAGSHYKRLDLNILNKEQLAEIASAIKIFSTNRKDPRLQVLFDQLKQLYRSK